MLALIWRDSFYVHGLLSVHGLSSYGFFCWDNWKAVVYATELYPRINMFKIEKWKMKIWNCSSNCCSEKPLVSSMWSVYNG